jgi:hypothetical protein
VSASRAADVAGYIAAQQERHRQVSFQEEFLSFPRKQASNTTRATSGAKNSLSPRSGARILTCDSTRLTPWASVFRPPGFGNVQTPGCGGPGGPPQPFVRASGNWKSMWHGAGVPPPHRLAEHEKSRQKETAPNPAY